MRQDMAGYFTFGAAFLAVLAASLVWSGPSGARVGMSGLAMIFAAVCCGWMVYCANRVVLLRLELQRGCNEAVVEAEVVEAEPVVVANAAGLLA